MASGPRLQNGGGCRLAAATAPSAFASEPPVGVAGAASGSGQPWRQRRRPAVAQLARGHCRSRSLPLDELPPLLLRVRSSGGSSADPRVELPAAAPAAAAPGRAATAHGSTAADVDMAEQQYPQHHAAAAAVRSPVVVGPTLRTQQAPAAAAAAAAVGPACQARAWQRPRHALLGYRSLTAVQCVSIKVGARPGTTPRWQHRIAILLAGWQDGVHCRRRGGQLRSLLCASNHP